LTVADSVLAVLKTRRLGKVHQDEVAEALVAGGVDCSISSVFRTLRRLASDPESGVRGDGGGWFQYKPAPDPNTKKLTEWCE